MTETLKAATHQSKARVKFEQMAYVFIEYGYFLNYLCAFFNFLYELIGWLPWLRNLINNFQAQCVVLNNNCNTPSGYFTMDTFWKAIMASGCRMQIYVPLLVYGTKGIPRLDSTLLLIKPCRRISNPGDNSRNDRVFINSATTDSTLETSLPLFDLY